MNVKGAKASIFFDFLKELTSEQKEAVTHLNGPLLVIAGAGTGKTRVITYRYCYLVLKEHIPQENILAVTFTEKASIEMSNRIKNLIGPLNENSWINTFHAFSSKILRNQGSLLGIKPDFKILNKLDQAVLFKKIFDDMDIKILRPLNNPYQYFDSLLAYFGRIKEELIGPNEYEDYVKDLEKKAPDDEKIKKEKEILSIYKTYEGTLRQNNYMDFSSLTYYAVYLLRNHSDVLEGYSNKFKYIMVDEYQDTNFAQNEIIKLLAYKHKNLMVVGDDDQSIYKFRGASVANILDFEKAFKDVKKIVLTQNFRSGQEVLNLAYESIQHNNPNRLEHINNINKKLISNLNSKSSVILIKSSDNLSEAESISDKILELKQNHKAKYNDIAILLRSTKNQAENICLALKERGIPYSISGESGFFHRKIIKDLLAILGFLNNKNEDIYLYRLFLSPIFNLDSDFLKTIGDICRENQIRLISLIENSQDYDIKEDIKSNLINIRSFLDKIREGSENKDIDAFIENIFKGISYFKNALDSESEETFLLNKFKEFASEFKEKYQVTKLKDFLFYLDLTMKLYEDFPLEDEEEDSKDKVNIMTIHKAKGLEFDNVIIANLAEQRFPQRFRPRPLEIAEALIKENLPEKEAYLEEERRLFYVAVTRAKSSLYLTYAENYGGVRKKKPSIFLKEIESLPLEQEEAKAKIHKTKEKAEIKKSKETLKLSYTQVNTYEMCPLKYKFSYVDNVPYKPQLSMAFGSFIHNVIEKFYKEFKNNNIYNEEVLLNLAKENWPQNIFTNERQEEEYKNKTNEMLSIYFKKHRDRVHLPLHIEYPFLLDIGNNVKLSGRIDRIDKVDNKTIELIDFKSSFNLPTQGEIDSDSQMSIYALAAKEILNINPEVLTAYYIMMDEKFHTKREEKDFKKLIVNINDTADKIRTCIFTPHKGWHCRFCDFSFICSEMERKY